MWHSGHLGAEEKPNLEDKMSTVFRLAAATALFALAGCQGGERDQRADTATVTTPPPETQAPAEKPAGAPGVAPGMIALGDSIFHGQAAGGTCFTCHGQDAKGTPMAPDLTDQQWLNADGSLQSITNIVTKGVPQPK